MYAGKSDHCGRQASRHTGNYRCSSPCVQSADASRSEWLPCRNEDLPNCRLPDKPLPTYVSITFDGFVSLADRMMRRPRRFGSDICRRLEPEGENRDDAALRWSLDVLLAEYQALRAELNEIRRDSQQTYTYLLATVGAVLASQVLFDSSRQLLNQRPILLLVAALATLWFPVRSYLLNTEVIAIGSYLREIIAPKINSIIIAVERDELHGSLIRPQWMQVDVGDPFGAGRSHPSAIVAYTMSWEDFHPWFRSGRDLTALMYGFATALLYGPAALLVWLYIASARPDWLELAILASILSLAGYCAVAHIWLNFNYLRRISNAALPLPPNQKGREDV